MLDDFTEIGIPPGPAPPGPTPGPQRGPAAPPVKAAGWDARPTLAALALACGVLVLADHSGRTRLREASAPAVPRPVPDSSGPETPSPELHPSSPTKGDPAPVPVVPRPDPVPAPVPAPAPAANPPGVYPTPQAPYPPAP